MPFDSLVRDTVIDPLTRLGITPIPQETVKAYKKAYRAHLLATSDLYRHYADLIRWRTTRRGKRSVAAFLATPMATVMSGLDRSKMPDELHDLAHKVHTEIPEGEFTVDYLSGDPILQVTYDFDGQRVKACLGIWEAGEIKMIAKQEGQTSD